ncbi:MAG: hypothetical protein NVS1B13_08380 [Flavisolibacter sp.]
MFTIREHSIMANENQIVQTALDRLYQHTALEGRWKPRMDEIDGELDLYTRGGDLHFFVEVKKELRQYQLPAIFETAETHQPFMVVAEKIFPTLKEKLREKGIGYLDAAGNIYVNTGYQIVWLEGQKAVEFKETITNRAFTKTGLRTVFYLLLKKDAINLPYRMLAEITGVALGNIKNVLEGLKDAGFILRINDKTLKIQNKRQLLERWIAGYGETLKPALHTGTYKFWDNNKLLGWQTLPIDFKEALWGGEPAAELLTNYLVPTRLTVYTNWKNQMIPKWTLIPHEKGNVHFYKKFWNDELVDKEKTVPPLLVYADLILTGDPRCKETAIMIYDKYLRDEIE